VLSPSSHSSLPLTMPSPQTGPLAPPVAPPTAARGVLARQLVGLLSKVWSCEHRSELLKQVARGEEEALEGAGAAAA
jgi:hypothetical protein